MHFHIQKAKEGTVPGNRAKKRSRNLGKALGEGLGLLKNECSRIEDFFLISRNDVQTRRKVGVFFVRFRRTYVLNNLEKEYLARYIF